MPTGSARKLVKKLRAWADKRFPVTFPVRCYVRKSSSMEDYNGYFLMGEGESATIAISDDLTHGEIVSTFLEEWAHARTAHLTDWEHDGDDPHHHPTFWAELGRITVAARGEVW